MECAVRTAFGELQGAVNVCAQLHDGADKVKPHQRPKATSYSNASLLMLILKMMLAVCDAAHAIGSL